MIDYEEGILRSLRRITRAIDLYSRRLATEHGLTGPQLVCLRTLARLGASTPSVIAREMHLSQPTVTGILDRLAAQGHVVRTRQLSGDRRRVSVDLTDKGRLLLRNAPSGLQDLLSAQLERVTVEERAAIHAALEQVVRMMESDQLPVTDPGPTALESPGGLEPLLAPVLERPGVEPE